jgi:hypothetical protein
VHVTDVPTHGDVNNYVLPELNPEGLVFIEQELRGYLSDIDFFSLEAKPPVNVMPLFRLASAAVLDITGSFRGAVHYPQVIVTALFAPLLLLWLTTGPLKIDLAPGLCTSWLVLFHPYLVAVTRLGWLQASVHAFMVLHLLSISVLFESDDRLDSRSALRKMGTLATGASTGILMVTWHGSSIYLSLFLLCLFLVWDLKERRFPRRTGFYAMIAYLPVTTGVLMRNHHPRVQLWMADTWQARSVRIYLEGLRRGGIELAAAAGIGVLLLAGFAVYWLVRNREKKLMLLASYALGHCLFVAATTRYFAARYYLPPIVIVYITAVTGLFALLEGNRSLTRTVAATILVLAVATSPFAWYRSTLGESPSALLVNEAAWELHRGGTAIREQRRLQLALRVIEPWTPQRFFADNHSIWVTRFLLYDSGIRSWSEVDSVRVRVADRESALFLADAVVDGLRDRTKMALAKHYCAFPEGRMVTLFVPSTLIDCIE